MDKFNYFSSVQGRTPGVVQFDASHFKKEETPSLVLEAADAAAVDAVGSVQIRSQAMALVLAWIAEGEYDVDSFGAMAEIMADNDESGDLDPEELDYLIALIEESGPALVSLGGDPDKVEAFIQEEDDEAGDKLGQFLSAKMDEQDLSDEEIIVSYAAKSDQVMEAVRKVVRNGKIVLKRTTVRKKKLSAAQRAALKKARMKANTGAAKLARKKAMKMRKSRGL